MQFDEQPLETGVAAGAAPKFDEQPMEAPARAATTLFDVGMAPFKRAGSELAGGAKQLFGYDTSAPLGISFPAGAGPALSGDIPKAIGDTLVATLNKVIGAGRMLGSGASAVGALVGKGTRYAGEQLGVPESILQPLETTADIGGTLASPTGLATAPHQLLRALSKVTTSPITSAISKAETTAASNQAINAAKAESLALAEARKAAAHQELAGATAGLDVATSKVASLQPGGQVTTPFGASLSAPVTNKEAYSFLSALKPTAVPSLKLTNLENAAKEILDEFKGIPSSIQPSGTKTAGQIAPTVAAMPPVGGVAFNPTALTDLQKEAYAPLLTTIQGHNKVGGLAIDKFQLFKQSLGEFVNNTGAPQLGRRLYRGMMDDLRDAATTNPAAAQLLKANDISAQNLAAQEIADAVTSSGTFVDKFGRLRLQPNTLRKKLYEDELMRGLPDAKKKEIADTLEEVFRANRRVDAATGEAKAAEKGVKSAQVGGPLPEVITPQKARSQVGSTFARHAVGWSLGGGAGLAMGGPMGAALGGAAGSMAMEALPRMIFQAAIKPGGAQFLKTLYADLPPTVGDMAKAAALTNFLASGNMQP